MKVSNLEDCKGCKKKKYPEIFSGGVLFVFEVFNKKTRQSQTIKAMSEVNAIRKSGWSEEEVRVIMPG